MAGKLPTRIGRYRVLCELGSGGMAVLYLARAVGPANFERLFAIKTIHDQLTREQSFIDMFLDEARLAARINHPNAVSVYEVGEDNGRYFIAMDYVNGETLAHTIARTWKQKPPFPIALAIHVAESTCEALHAAHELTDARGHPLSVVHRDVSPQNIMIGYDGVARIMDFGVAKAADRLVQTRSGTHKGKVAYMAPEQIRGEDVDRRADIFALGVVLWEVLAGKRLFKAANDFATAERIKQGRVPPLPMIRKDLPAGLWDIVRRALSPDPSGRYATARELAGELRTFAKREAVILSTADVERFMKSTFADRFSARQEMARQAVEAEGLVDPHALEIRSDSGSFSGLGTADLPEKSFTHPETEVGQSDARPFAPSVPQPKGGRVALVASALSIVGALLLFVLFPREPPEKEIVLLAAPPRPVAADVRIEFEVEPENALVRVDGRTVERTLTVPRSSSPLSIEVSLDGYEPYTREVTPDRSLVLAVKLKPKAEKRKAEKPRPIKRRRPKPKKRLLLEGDDL